ncbi:acyltransferase [Fibrella arboris]|uniref:acyltransferase n=1 Tax=Fibrella arboris TaxID=3242486 RepID=UPI003520F9CD
MINLVKLIINRLSKVFLQIDIPVSSYVSVPFIGLTGGRYIKIGQNSTIGKHAWLAAFDTFRDQRFKPSINIGDNVTIGNFFCLTAIDKVEIGDGCLFSEYVYISDHSHGTDPRLGSPAIQPLHSKGNVIIGKNTFVGYRASILPGVKLGEHCVVGAHSVVTHSFPDFSVVAGVPARLLKNTDSNLSQI